MLLIDKINEKLNKIDFNLDLESAVYKTKERILYFVFRYADHLMLDKQIKDIVDDTIIEELGSKVSFVVKYHKNYYDQDIIAEATIVTMRKDFPMVAIQKEQIELVKSKTKNQVTVALDISFKDFVEPQKDKMIDAIKKQLVAKYFDKFEVEIIFKEGLESKPKVFKEDFHFQTDNTISYEIEVETKEPFIGELIDAPIYPIAYYKLPAEGVSICGRIENLIENHTKARVDDDGKEKASKEYYTFELVDFSGRIRVVLFVAFGT